MAGSDWQTPHDDSILFDFTLNSNDQRIKEAAERLLTLREFSTNHAGKKNRCFRHLQAIVENLALANKQGNEYRVSYHRGRSFYSENGFRQDRRKNPRGLSRSLIDCIDILVSHNFIHNKNGFHDPVNPQKSVLARMQATQRFIDEIIKPLRLHEIRFGIRQQHKPIEVKDENKRDVTGKHSKTPAFIDMASRVEAYNQCYDAVELAFNDQRYGLVIPEMKRLHRVFNADSLEKGGRFYGGWWESKSGEDRKSILIDGKQTVELDYTGNHIGLLYGMTGSPMADTLRDDPYAVDEPYQRAEMKLCILRSINTSSRERALQSVNRQHHEDRKPDLPLHVFDDLLAEFFSKHPTIEGLFFQPDLSLTLQYLDSVVTDAVLHGLIAKGIPVLPIHDSFIVTKEHEKELLAAMKSAYLDSSDSVIRNSFTAIKGKA